MPLRVTVYPIWLLFGVMIAFTSALGGVLFSLNNKMESGRWASECLEIKSNAVSTRDPRLVFLSGSNSLFGISAKRLSLVHGIESVNGGIHAGLGISYILDYGRRYFSPGRIIVLPLEYELYEKTSSDPAYQYQVIGFDPNYFTRMSLYQKFEFVMDISLYDRMRLIKEKVFPSEPNLSAGYQSRNLNAWGDETSNSLNNVRGKVRAKMLTGSRPSIYSISDRAWSELESFARDARSGGSQVVLAYPNIYFKAFDYDLNRKFFSDLQARAARLGVPLIGTPQESAFFDDFAFDMEYHENSEGRLVATDRFFGNLAALIGVENLRRSRYAQALLDQQGK